MYRPEPLLHMVGREEVCNAGKLVKKVVFEAEHRRWTNDGSLRVDGARNFLTPAL